jgi:hypothetical protein
MMDALFDNWVALADLGGTGVFALVVWRQLYQIRIQMHEHNQAVLGLLAGALERTPPYGVPLPASDPP